MQKITPFLWFDNQAEEAIQFYTSVFKDAKMGKVFRYGDSGPGPKNSVMTVEFELFGQQFVALNGGPHFKFTPAVSFVVSCESQQEIDYYWQKLSEGGAEERCGWLRDKFGLSWQIVPANLPAMMKDPSATERVMQAMMPMNKLDLAALEKAAEGELVA
jgi:predicted 3-demethylubiquinone-9 3-methyltransferase (glyoxalase superfamily)